MKNIVENQGIKNDKPLALSYEQLKQRLDAAVAERDALAAENCIQDCIITAVKDLVHDSEGVIGWHLNGDIAPWDEVLPELSHSETPTTTAALAEVEAKAIERFIAKKLKQLEAMYPGSSDGMVHLVSDWNRRTSDSEAHHEQ
ncbi:hypothetical protein [Serratia fonticola]